MAAFTFIWVGKASRKNPEQEIAERYLKRIQGFVKVSERVLKPSTTDVRTQDSQKILAALKAQDYLILCDERGTNLSSTELAAHIDVCFNQGHSQIVWVIGGAMGVSEELRIRANLILSFSKLTFPHAIARIMLYEQAYRALCVRANHPYHHGE